MKTFLKTLGIGGALAFVLFAGQVRGQDSNTPQAQPDNAQAPVDSSTQADNNVSFQTFYNQLANQGTWIQTDNYGYVFQPTENDPNWRPYTYGHWVDTDEGMAWDSDEPFGWATYHYGRWANLDGYGWVWVPGYTWAPAWVSWRDGDDDVGWAPLPPDADVGIDFFDEDFDWGFGFHIGDDCDVAFGIGPWCYNFCPVAFIGDRDCWRHFRDRRDNFALIDHTRNVTNINFRRDGTGQFGHVSAQGPSVAALNARAQTPIEHAQLTSVSQPGNAGLHGNTLAVYAPTIDPATIKTARPGSVTQTLANTSVNRGTDINHSPAVNSRIGPAGPTAEQINGASLARDNMPAGAKIATADTRVSRPLTQPLTSLRTFTRSTPMFGTGLRESTVTGASRVSVPSVSAESRYTGQEVSPQTSFPSRTTSSFHSVRSYPPGGGYRSSSLFHTSAPVFHSSVPAYQSQPRFGGGNFQSESGVPAYHSESHFGGGTFQGSAPAEHFSGGSFGGGRSYSGGGSRAASGGGQSGNGRH